MKLKTALKSKTGLKKEGNLKKRMTKKVDNPEKENDPKHFTGRPGPYNFLQISHNIISKQPLNKTLFSV